MKKLSRCDMRKIKGGIQTCQAILICNCNGTNQSQTVNCVNVGGDWQAGCRNGCSWEMTVVSYCNLC